jgi:thiamine pyrophosphokinase
MRVVIIANSPEVDADLVRRCAAEADRIVVADGAAHRLPEGVIPHTIVGDFDSLEMVKARQRFPHIDFVHLPDQYSNDLEKAIELSCASGATDIVIVSALGGLPDQSFATFSVLCKYSQRVALELRHGGMTCRAFCVAANEEQVSSTIEVRSGARISCLPYGDGAIVSLIGTEYEVTRAPLPVGALGVGNRAKSERITVTIHRGMALLFIEQLP